LLFEKYTCQRIMLSGVREGRIKNDFHVIFNARSFYFVKTSINYGNSSIHAAIAFISRQD